MSGNAATEGCLESCERLIRVETHKAKVREFIDKKVVKLAC